MPHLFPPSAPPPSRASGRRTPTALLPTRAARCPRRLHALPESGRVRGGRFHLQLPVQWCRLLSRRASSAVPAARGLGAASVRQPDHQRLLCVERRLHVRRRGRELRHLQLFHVDLRLIQARLRRKFGIGRHAVLVEVLIFGILVGRLGLHVPQWRWRVDLRIPHLPQQRVRRGPDRLHRRWDVWHCDHHRARQHRAASAVPAARSVRLLGERGSL